MLPAKKLKPLTARQVDVLAKIAFGEIFCVEEPNRRWGYNTRKWNDRGVDASSVVRKLFERKLIRRRTIESPRSIADPAGSQYHYATPTPAGFAELEKHPAPWND